MLTAKKLLAGAFAAGLAVSLAAEARELRVADTHPADYPTVQTLDHMGQLLAERSGNRLTLKVFHSRQLGEEQETVEQTRFGALDMTRVNLVPMNALVPESVVPSLPFLFRSIAHMRKVMDGPIGADLAKSFERHGFVVLAFFDSGARSFYNRRQPVSHPADLRGLRIRVQQSPLAEAMVEALGAVPAPLPYGQVGIGLKTGVLDGAENNWPSYHDTRHFETAPFYSLTEHSMAPEALLMSRKVWDKLKPAEQILIRSSAKDAALHMRSLWGMHEELAERQVRAGGAKVNAVDKAAFAEAMKPVYDRFAADPRLRNLVRRIQAAE